jgi:hypothetical protein
LQEIFGGEMFGTAILAPGDVNQDGYGDIAVLARGTTYLVVNSDGHGSTARTHPGCVYLFSGGPAPASVPFATLSAPSDHPYAFAGTSLDLDGDGASEILFTQWSEGGSSMTQQTQVAAYQGSDSDTKPLRVFAGFKPGDDFGIALGP